MRVSWSRPTPRATRAYSLRVAHSSSLAQDFGPPWMQRTVGRTSSNHTPIAAILLCSIFGLLTFLGVQNTGDASLNQPILTLSVFFTSTQGCVYISQCIAFLRFKHGLDRLEKDEIFSRDSELYKRRHYRAYWQPGWAWVGLIGCALIIFFSGWPAIYIMVARKDLSTGSLLKPNKLFAADLVGDYSGVSAIDDMFRLSPLIDWHH